ncbi:MAG: 2-C-methyl-D-erythritol 2,4-cyclodiphosphate synthase [Candidatus Binatia bacterium]
MRAGIGFDAHRFGADRPLVLGGVTFAGAPGLHGHSDADVVCHAICDALLGAANLGDIGTHFPDTDPAFEGASGADLLRRVRELLAGRGYDVASVDVTLMLESPMIGAHRAEMSSNIAASLRVEADRVSVKATTTEGMGFVGRGEGAACMAVVVVREPDD